jgi:hypothetical protein
MSKTVRDRWRAMILAASVFLLALIVRVVLNLTVARSYTPTADAAYYILIAQGLLHSGCFCAYPPASTISRPPLWPMTIAVIYGIFGPHDLYVRIFLCFTGAGTCALIYLFAADIFNPRFGLLADVLASIYPQLYVYDDWLYADSLFIFLTMAFAYSLLRLQRTGKIRWMIWSGLFLGLAALQRPNGIATMALLIAWVIIIGVSKALPWKRVIKEGIVVLCVATLLIAPWTIRNYAVSGSFVPVAVGQGTVLIGSYNDAITKPTPFFGSWINPDVADPALGHRYHFAERQGPRAQLSRENSFQQAAEQWIKQHVSLLPTLLEAHFIDLWKPLANDSDQPVSRFSSRESAKLVTAMADDDLFFVYVLAALGLLFTFRQRWKELLFFYLLAIYTIAQCLALYGTARFRAPIEPLLIILIAGAIWWFVQQLRVNRTMGKTNNKNASPQKTVASSSLISDSKSAGTM